MEKIKRLLLYAGATPEEFAQVQQEMHLYNYNLLVAFLAISIIFLLISAVYAVFSTVLAPNLPAYLIVLGISCLLLPITLYVGRRSRAGLQICLSLFLSSLYSLSIYLSTVTSPGGPATAFIAFLLTLPTLFTAFFTTPAAACSAHISGRPENTRSMMNRRISTTISSPMHPVLTL